MPPALDNTHAIDTAALPRARQQLNRRAPKAGYAVVTALIGYTAIFAVLQLSGWNVAGHADLLRSTGAIPPYLAVALLAIGASRRGGSDRRTRRAWQFLALALLTGVVGDAIWSWYGQVLNREPFPSWADAAYLAFYPLALAALLLFPAAARSRTEKIKLGLDAMVVLLGGWMIVWYLVLGPTVRDAGGSLFETMLAAAYPALDMLVLFGIAAVLLRSPSAELRRAMYWLNAGLLLTVGYDLGFAWMELTGTYDTNTWIDLLWVAAAIPIGISALQTGPGARDTAEPAADRATAGFSVLPYSAVAVGLLLLLVVGLRTSSGELTGLIVCRIILIGLVATRQVASLTETARLTRQTMLLSQEVQASEARFRSLVQNASDIIGVLDPDGTVRYISPSVLRVLGTPPDTFAGRDLGEWIHPDDLERARAFLEQTLRGRGISASVDLRLRHAEGSWCHLEALGNNLLHDPNVGGIVINARDTTERKLLEAQLVYQASHDVLTGLPNRALFLERLEETLARKPLEPLLPSAVLFVDLDGFKSINDTLGHAIGDGLLVAAAGRIAACIRSGDTAARLGGDEFTVLLADVAGVEEAVAVARRILSRFDEPFGIDGHKLRVSPSIGISLSAESTSADELLRRADQAMYRAKLAGRARFVVYDYEVGEVAAG